MALANAYTKFGHVIKMRYRTERLLYVYTREDLTEGITQIRFKTDIWYFWVFVALQFFLVVLGTRYFIASDSKRLFSGVDSFGNTCGKSNNKLFQHPFSGMDHSNREYVMYLSHDAYTKEAAICVSACIDNNQEIYEYAYPVMNIENWCHAIGIKCWKTGRKTEIPHWNRCYPEDASIKDVLCKREIFKDYTLDVTFGILKLGFVIILGFALTLFGMWLLLQHPYYFSKCAFTSLPIVCGVSTAYLWYRFLTSDVKNMDFLYIYHCPNCINLILATVMSFILVLVLWDLKHSEWMEKESVLLRLCSGSIKNIPGICFSPLLVIMVEIIFMCNVFVMYLLMRSCYIPLERDNALIYKEPLFVRVHTSWFFYLASYWTLRFIFNCGLYLSSDVVCRWYFDPKASSGSRIKLFQPAISSLAVFHLGSAVKGTIMYCFVNKLMIFIFSPYYWKMKSKQLEDKKVSIGYIYNFYEQFLRYIDPVTYTSLAMFGFDLQISSQITYVTLLGDFQIRHQYRMKQVSKSIAHFKYSILVAVHLMLEFGAEASEDYLCAKNIPVLAALMIAYFVIGDLCDLLEQTYRSFFMCVCTDFGCNITSDENNFTRRNLMKYYLRRIDEEEANDKLVE